MSWEKNVREIDTLSTHVLCIFFFFFFFAFYVDKAFTKNVQIKAFI